MVLTIEVIIAHNYNLAWVLAADSTFTQENNSLALLEHCSK